MNVPLTPLRFLEYAERQYGGRTAVVCGEKRGDDGGKHVMISQFHATEVFRLIETERVEAFKAVPAMATTLVNRPERGNFDLGRVHTKA